MAKSFSKREWNRVWNNVKYNVRLYFWAVIEFIWLFIIRYAALAIGCVFLACIVLPVCLILVFNPVSFLLWALLIPASAASWIVSNDEDTVIDHVAGFCIALVKWEMYLLPWYAKKHFIAKFPGDFKSSTVMKYFRGLKGKEAQMFFKKLVNLDCPEKFSEVWNVADDEERKTLLTAKVESLNSNQRLYRIKLTRDEVLYMLNHGMHSVMREYIKYRTPSAGTFQTIMDRVNDKDSDIDCESWCVELIIAHGLSSELISWVYSCGSNKLKNLVENALRIHGQKDVTKRLLNNSDVSEWMAFLKKTPEICAEAQMEMNHKEMVKLFYKTGHHMAEEAIFYWLSKAMFVEEIFTNEPENGLISPRIKALVSGNETLSRMLIRLK